MVATAYLLGVSTRRVEKLAESLGVTQLSKSQVSAMAKHLDEQVTGDRAVCSETPTESTTWPLASPVNLSSPPTVSVTVLPTEDRVSLIGQVSCDLVGWMRGEANESPQRGP